MDGVRFDNLARMLVEPASRRRVFRGMPFGLAMALNIAAADQTVAGKKKCPSCRKRKKGKCKARQPDGTACPGGTCRDGQCVVESSAAPCLGLADDALCNGGTGRCLGEACNPPPVCKVQSAGCSTAEDCCSHDCGSNGRCRPGSLGTACAGPADCLSKNCVGYRCVQGLSQPSISCQYHEECASNRCGCFTYNNQTICMCRNANCGGIGAPCVLKHATQGDLACCAGLCNAVNSGGPDGTVCGV